MSRWAIEGQKGRLLRTSDELQEWIWAQSRESSGRNRARVLGIQRKNKWISNYSTPPRFQHDTWSVTIYTHISMAPTFTCSTRPDPSHSSFLFTFFPGCSGILRGVPSPVGSGTSLLMFFPLEPPGQGDLSWLLQLVPLSNVTPACDGLLEPKATLSLVDGGGEGRRMVSPYARADTVL